MAQNITVMKLASGIATALIGLSAGGLLLGMIVHEESHAIAGLLFGVPIVSWSWNQVIYVRSPDYWVNVMIGLAGGTGQALVSMLFVWSSRWYMLKLENGIFYERIINGKRSLAASMIFGFEFAFLTIAFHGTINAVMEGFFYDIYTQIHSSSFIWLPVLALCGLLAFYVLYSRQSRFLKA